MQSIGLAFDVDWTARRLGSPVEYTTFNVMVIERVVLQVEDDEPSYFVFRQIFEEICPDLRLQRAQNGAEALVMIRDLVGKPSVRLVLVLLDVFLPLMNGWEVLDSIRAVGSLRHVPVVMFTGQLIERDRLRCADLDVDYVEKPADLRKLVSLVKEICAKAMQPQ